MKIFVSFLFLLFLLTGCYQASLAPMIGPAAGVTQGNLAYSAASTGFTYGVKHKTGKFPIEHVFNREKSKIVKKIDTIETDLKDTSLLVKNKIIQRKNNIKSKGKNIKTRWVLHLKEIKNVNEKEAFPASKPRYSYWPEAK